MYPFRGDAIEANILKENFVTQLISMECSSCLSAISRSWYEIVIASSYRRQRIITKSIVEYEYLPHLNELGCVPHTSVTFLTIIFV